MRDSAREAAPPSSFLLLLFFFFFFFPPAAFARHVAAPSRRSRVKDAADG